MMMTIMMVLAIISGMALSSQAAINGNLSQRVGVIRTSLLTFSIGAALCGLLILFFQPPQPQSLLTVPKWQLIGALFGMFYMLAMVASVARIGVALATIATIFGQMSMSLLIDTLGWLGNAPIALNGWRVAAMACIAGALVCIWLAAKKPQSSTVERLS